MNNAILILFLCMLLCGCGSSYKISEAPGVRITEGKYMYTVKIVDGKVYAYLNSNGEDRLFGPFIKKNDSLYIFVNEGLGTEQIFCQNGTWYYSCSYVQSQPFLVNGRALEP